MEQTYRRAKRKKTKPTSPKREIDNRIADILTQRGIGKVVPTRQVLEQLAITMHRFNKILNNKVEMTFTEATIFAEWLQVGIEELTSHPAPFLIDKFNLKK